MITVEGELLPVEAGYCRRSEATAAWGKQEQNEGSNHILRTITCWRSIDRWREGFAGGWGLLQDMVQALLVTDSELPGILLHCTQAGPGSSQELQPWFQLTLTRLPGSRAALVWRSGPHFKPNLKCWSQCQRSLLQPAASAILGGDIYHAIPHLIY